MKAAHSFGVPADFEYKIRDGVLVIVDLNLGGKSVTNDAESVVATIDTILGDKGEPLPKAVIYRDSDGVYDGMLVGSDGDVTFYHIGETNEQEAIQQARKAG